MNKKTLTNLGKVWEREIDGHMYQPPRNAKWPDEFVREGLIFPCFETFSTPLGPMVCKGFGLTHLGRMIYCASCKDEE